MCILENVDRLLKSPSKQRGRDFGIILSCFNQQDYSVEWRVVNAADYGAAQRRKRVFIFAYKNDMRYTMSDYQIEDIFLHDGFMAKVFPVISCGDIFETEIQNDLKTVSDNFQFDFKNCGYMSHGKIYTTRVTEKTEQSIKLVDIVETDVGEKYYIRPDAMAKWEYLKGAKKIPRVSANGHEWVYSEGAISFPDPLDKPSRTMLTSEGSVNRSTHVIKDIQTSKLRILTPVETERLQGFEDNWTNTGMPERMRYFCMGNALVVPMITRMGRILDEIIELED